MTSGLTNLTHHKCFLFLTAEEGVNYPVKTRNVGNERKDVNDPCDDFLHKVGTINLYAGKLTMYNYLTVRNVHTSLDYIKSFWQMCCVCLFGCVYGPY